MLNLESLVIWIRQQTAWLYLQVYQNQIFSLICGALHILERFRHLHFVIGYQVNNHGCG